MRTFYMTSVALVAVCCAASVKAQGVGERIGNAIDRGVNVVGNEVRGDWQQFRDGINRMGIESRVYTRLHWDKVTNGSTIEIEAPAVGTIVLKGSVPDAIAKRKAEQLTLDTVGVEKVVNQLGIAPPTAQTVPQR